MLRQFLLLLVILVVVPVLGMAALSLIARRPVLDLKDGKLPDCPTSPNCVCSYQTSKRHGIEPIKCQPDSPLETWNRLKQLLAKSARTTVLSDGESLLHVEIRTPIFRFVDDMQFQFDAKEKVIHVRAAARSGYSDMGANRNRVEAIRREIGYEEKK